MVNELVNLPNTGTWILWDCTHLEDAFKGSEEEPLSNKIAMY